MLTTDVVSMSGIVAFILFTITNSYLQWVPFPTLGNFYLYRFGVLFSYKYQKLGKQFKQIGSFPFLT